MVLIFLENDDFNCSVATKEKTNGEFLWYGFISIWNKTMIFKYMVTILVMVSTNVVEA